MAQPHAFGAPGSAPSWASSDKDFVSASLGPARLWATFGHGIVNEVYWPSTGEPQLRDLGFYLVGSERWLDLKRIARYRLETPAPSLPLPTITHEGEDYLLTLEALPDPLHDALLVRFSLDGPYRLVVLAAPHLQGTGYDNRAWVEEGALYAAHDAHALCLAADIGLEQPSAGYVGASDGWHDLDQHGRLTWDFAEAGPGNVALAATLPGPRGVLALGFADTPRGAATQARSSLAGGFEPAREQFLEAWTRWGRTLQVPAPTPELERLARVSATVLRIHADRTYTGALVASLSTPWGNSTDTLGGYHLVWPRDATLSAFALIDAGQVADAQHILGRFVATQEADGHWAQNAYPSGLPFWTGVQLDETAFPVLLAAKLREIGVPEPAGIGRMVASALRYVARTGPCSDQDRWEENPGVNPFSLAVAIAALVAGTPWLAPADAAAAVALADEWNERLEHWCYVTDTPLASRLGLGGCYVRVVVPADGPSPGTDTVELRNRDGETIVASALLSLDFSYLTRLGLRSAADPRIRDTVTAVDRILRVSTPSGDLFHRYNEDGYGEHADGHPFNGSGIGRLWPLLAGERGHLALQAGEDPLPYLETICRCASTGGLLPEQVWDADPIPSRGLRPGRPSGSAMPLLWSHAEFLKLLIAREQKRPVELLRDVEAHFRDPHPASAWRWRDEAPVWALPAGRGLSVEGRRPFTLHFGWDGWQDVEERDASPGDFGLWRVVFAPADLKARRSLEFTRRRDGSWEGRDHAVRLHEDTAQTLRRPG